MPRPKSLLKKLSVDVAQRSHNCQHVPSHRIQQGEKRLKVTKDRTNEHYCVLCAVESIDASIRKLQELKRELLGE